MDALERQRLVFQGSEARVRTSQGIYLHQLIEAQAERTPDACAVVHQDRRLSYRELDAAANRLARYLRQLGSGPETKVAICMDPSVELVVAILAVLKAGSAYVPISPTTPNDRLQRILHDTKSCTLVTDGALVPGGAQLPCRVVTLDAATPEIEGQSAERLVNEAVPQNLAYVFHTSGSTGAPRGVMIPHQGICNTLRWRQATFPFHAADRMLLTLSFVFDASIYQLFQPLLAGACLIHSHRPPIHGVAVEFRDSILRFLVRTHRHKGEPT